MRIDAIWRTIITSATMAEGHRSPATLRMLTRCHPSLSNHCVAAHHACTRDVRAAAPDDDGNAVTTPERRLLSAEAQAKPERPPLYAVVLLNDDYTPREFVTQILKRHFGLDGDAAQTIMMHAHRHGEARVRAWQKDIAETKMHNAEEEAHEAGHPLKFRCHPIEP